MSKNKNKQVVENNNTPKVSLFQRFKEWHRKSTVVAKIEDVLRLIWKYILIALNCLFPVKEFKRVTYDRLRHDQQKIIVSLLFLFPVMFGFLLFFLYPLLRSFYMSFGTVEILKTGGVAIHFGEFFIKNGPGGSIDWANPVHDPAAKNIFFNYIQAFTAGSVDFPVGLATTAWNTIVDTAVITIFSLLVAVMLNGNFKGRGIVRAIFFLPVVLNSEAVNLALEASANLTDLVGKSGTDALRSLFDMNAFFTNLGIPVKLVTFLSGITSTIYDTISYSGIQILIFLAAIQSVPRHLYEAAKIEGATAYESFWKITLPMVTPMMVPIIVFTIVDSFLRSDINTIIDLQYNQSNYGMHAAMSWSYVVVSVALIGITVGILSRWVFYYDNKK